MSGSGLPNIPTARLQPLLRAWLSSGRSLRELGDRAGMSERVMGAVWRGERNAVRFDTADRIVTAINPFLWHVAPPDGLGDIYGSPLINQDPQEGDRRARPAA